jgi:hypothetical protein
MSDYYSILISRFFFLLTTRIYLLRRLRSGRRTIQFTGQQGVGRLVEMSEGGKELGKEAKKLALEWL